MFNIRFHGRGGQGIKTAGRILGSAFFFESFEVQDAPRYGAERRGAPMFAYVRADRKPINERGIIRQPDLVIVADDSLVPVPAAGVLQGVTDQTLLLIVSHETEITWQHRLNIKARIVTLSPDINQANPDLPLIGTACAGAAARLVGVISSDHLIEAITEELSGFSEHVLTLNRTLALTAFHQMDAYQGLVKEQPISTATDFLKPDWIDLPLEKTQLSSPTIDKPLTSMLVKTGLWRTQRPVIDYSRCKQCWWICSSFCPDSAINVVEQGKPVIDYEHCKGCMICVAQCPSHAIETIPEAVARQQENQGAHDEP